MGILGATVMPHSLFLGSALATQDRISFRAPQDVLVGGTRDNNTVSDEKDTNDSFLLNQPSDEKKVWHLRRLYEKFKRFMLDAFLKPPPNLYCERQNNSFEFVRAHIYFGMFDIVGSLFGFAVMINSLYVILFFNLRSIYFLCYLFFFRILILASAVFFYGSGNTGTESPASLFDAYDLIRDTVGKRECLAKLFENGGG